MRISALSHDPDYNPAIFECEVYLDGQPCPPLCHTADEEAGIVYCWAQGPDGKPFVDPEDCTRPKEVQFRGDVKVVLGARRKRA